MIYLSWRINFVDILVNVFIVALTTGITYYLFSVLPSRRRLNTLKQRLLSFSEELKDSILDSENEFRQTYELYEEEVPSKNDGDMLVWSLIKIKDWKNFFSTFRFLTLMNTYFNDYWQGKELMLLVNSLVMDNRMNIRLSVCLSKLSAIINHSERLLGEKTKNIWEIEHMKQFIKTKHDNELISLVVKSLEEMYATAHEIDDLISKVLK